MAQSRPRALFRPKSAILTITKSGAGFTLNTRRPRTQRGLVDGLEPSAGAAGGGAREDAPYIWEHSAKSSNETRLTLLRNCTCL